MENVSLGGLFEINYITGFLVMVIMVLMFRISSQLASINTALNGGGKQESA